MKLEGLHFENWLEAIFVFLTILPGQLSEFLNPQSLVRKNPLFHSLETYIQTHVNL